MFDYAPTVGFLLHISMDMSASGGDLDSFDNVVRGYVGKPGYFAPTAGKPFITTFSDGGRTNTEWDDWKQSTLANELYFCPDFDGTQGYTTADPGWWLVFLFPSARRRDASDVSLTGHTGATL